jgi:hypothetical protein
MGVTQTDVQTMFSSIDPSQIASFAEGLLSKPFQHLLVRAADAARRSDITQYI